MQHVIRHDLDPALARRATEKAFAGYKARFSAYSPQAEWVTATRAEISFSAKGVKLAGTVVLEPNEIHLDLEVPFIFRIFKNKALEIIENEIKKWIGKARAGELDD